MKIAERTWEAEPHTFMCRREGQSVELARDGIVLLEGTPAFFDRLARQIKAVASGRPANSGRRWTPEEDDRLRVGHAERVPNPALAVALERSVSAIVARLFVLGLSDDPGVTLRYPVHPER